MIGGFFPVQSVFVVTGFLLLAATGAAYWKGNDLLSVSNRREKNA
ncbi:hypothetical protein [Neobacillus sp. 204]